MLRDATATWQPGCVLLDVVLGYAAHPDPATGLAETVSTAAKDAVVIAHVCGTADDPQDARRQEDILSDAGAVVAPSNAAAARLALHALT
jgi:FdrA protein